MTSSLRWIVLGASVCSGLAAAADFDGSKNLICAPVKAMDCADGVDCVSGTPLEMGAPAFLRIDFEKKAVSGTYRSSPILQMEKSESQVLLQGFDQGLGWTVAITGSNGHMHATMAGQEGAIILSGSCTTL